MMYAPILRKLPDDMRMPMLELAETIEQTMRAELAVRREDIESLENNVEQMVEGQRQLGQRVDHLQAALAALAEAQRRTEQRVEELAEAQRRTEQRLDRLEAIVEQLAEAQKRTEQALFKLIERVDKMDHTVSWLRGDQLERTYRERAHGRFGSFLRRVRVVAFQEIEPQLDERLPEEVVDDLRQLDLIVRGEPKGPAGGGELWLAVEVSAVVDLSDIERARRRAAALRQAGYRAAAVAAGEKHVAEAELSAAAVGVAMVENGSVLYLAEALRAAG